MSAKKKNIAFLTVNQLRPYHDGGSNLILELSALLKKWGHRVHIFNFITNELYRRDIYEEILSSNHGQNIVIEGTTSYIAYESINIYQEILPYSTNEMKEKYQNTIKVIIDKMQRQKIDYLFTVDNSLISLLSAYLLGVAGGHIFNSLENIKSFKYYNPIYIEMLKKRTVFTVSQFMKAKLEQLLGIDSVVWYPIINFNKYLVQAKTNETKAIGFYSGGVLYAKGDEIVNGLIKKMPDGCFIIVGENYFNQWERIPYNLKYLGQTVDMRNFYGQIKLLLVPSLIEEGFSRVILEAAANGVPSIANRLGGIPEALGNSGILIDFDLTNKPNLNELTSKYILVINRLLNNHKEYTIYSQKALLRARDYIAEQDKMSRYIYDTYIQ